MNPKKRLKMSLNGERVDRPPCICPGGMMNMVTAELMERMGIYLPEAHTDARKMADLAKAVYEQGCFENCGVPFCMTIEAEEMGARVDLGSQIYEPHVVKYAIDSVSDYEKLSGIDLTKGRAKVVLDAIGMLKEEVKDMPIIGNLTGPISTASSVIEPVVFYKELRKKKCRGTCVYEFCDRAADRIWQGAGGSGCRCHYNRGSKRYRRDSRTTIFQRVCSEVY